MPDQGSWSWISSPPGGWYISIYGLFENTQIQYSWISMLILLLFPPIRCGPCTMVAPHFERLSNTYPQAVFLKVDVDECQGTAFSQGITAMPTFIFYRSRYLSMNGVMGKCYQSCYNIANIRQFQAQLVTLSFNDFVFFTVHESRRFKDRTFKA